MINLYNPTEAGTCVPYQPITNNDIMSNPTYSKCFTTDVKNLKKDRQEKNYQLCLLGRFVDKGTFNPKALERFLNYTKITVSEILSDPTLHRSAVFACAIDANRQGGKDEHFILNGINEQYKNITIKNLTATDARPMSNGKIFDKKQIKEYGLTKEDGLKTFDFKILGNVQGWGTAKVKNGNGGHQDNVTREMLEWIEWVNTFGKKDLIYVSLLDGNGHNFKILNESRQRDNIWIVHHKTFQDKLNQYE